MAKKGCHKMASGNISNIFTVPGGSVQLHKEAILKELQLKGLYYFVFS